MDKSSFSYGSGPLATHQSPSLESDINIPGYLKDAYWWAYLHPKAVRLFERQWLINLILWGNFNRLRDSVLDEFGSVITGRLLQVACVYGDLTEKLSDRLDQSAQLDVVDVARVQLINIRNKIGTPDNIILHQQDSAMLRFPDASFDNTLVFFLLHEQPEEVRRATIAEAIRVTRRGGRIVLIDYHRPGYLNPMRYLMTAVFRFFEPYAENFWRHDILEWLPREFTPARVHKQTYFARLYQKTILHV